MGIKEDIKAYIVKSGHTITEVNNKLNQKYNRNHTPQNLSKKISTGTLKYKEALEIADVIGYEIEWRKKAD